MTALRRPSVLLLFFAAVFSGPASATEAVLRPPKRTAAVRATSAPKRDSNAVVKRLPAPFDDVFVAGGGRYLVMRFPKLRKLGVWDVSEAAIARYIPLEEENAPFGAGLEKVVVGLPKKERIERWSLATGEREQTAFPRLKTPIFSVVMGSASDDLVVVSGHFFSLSTLKQKKIRAAKGDDEFIGSRGPSRHSDSSLCPSAEGNVFGWWNTHVSPASASTFVVEGDVFHRHRAGNLGHVLPGPDGRTVFTKEGIAGANLKRSDPEDAKLGYCIPAVQGNLFLSLKSADEEGNGGGADVYLLGQSNPIAQLEDFEHGLHFDQWDRDEFGAWKRVYLIPQAKRIVVLPPSNDRLVLYRFDPDAALTKSGIDYLYIASRPPRTVRAGEEWKYSVDVRAKNSPASVKLDSGPDGMKAIGAVLTWKVPSDAPAGEHEVVVSVRDAKGNDQFHSFSVKVVK